jgi:hypothetical protein
VLVEGCISAENRAFDAWLREKSLERSKLEAEYHKTARELDVDILKKKLLLMDCKYSNSREDAHDYKRRAVAVSAQLQETSELLSAARLALDEREGELLEARRLADRNLEAGLALAAKVSDLEAKLAEKKRDRDAEAQVCVTPSLWFSTSRNPRIMFLISRIYRLRYSQLCMSRHLRSGDSSFAAACASWKHKVEATRLAALQEQLAASKKRVDALQDQVACAEERAATAQRRLELREEANEARETFRGEAERLTEQQAALFEQLSQETRAAAGRQSELVEKMARSERRRLEDLAKGYKDELDKERQRADGLEAELRRAGAASAKEAERAREALEAAEEARKAQKGAEERLEELERRRLQEQEARALGLFCRSPRAFFYNLLPQRHTSLIPPFLPFILSVSNALSLFPNVGPEIPPLSSSHLLLIVPLCPSLLLALSSPHLLYPPPSTPSQKKKIQ